MKIKLTLNTGSFLFLGNIALEKGIPKEYETDEFTLREKRMLLFYWNNEHKVISCDKNLNEVIVFEELEENCGLDEKTNIPTSVLITPTGTQITGLAEPGATVKIKVTGLSTITVTADDQGAFEHTFEPALVNGELITVTATLPPKKESDGVDVTAPTIVEELVVPPYDLVYKAQTKTLTGKAETGLTIEVTDSNSNVISSIVEVEPDSTFTAVLTKYINKGQKGFTRTLDEEGNKSKPVEFEGGIRKLPPATDLNLKVEDGVIKLTGKYIEDSENSVVKYNINSSLYYTVNTYANGTFSHSFDQLMDGDVVKVRIDDAFENKSDPTSITYEQAQDVKLTSPTDLIITDLVLTGKLVDGTKAIIKIGETVLEAIADATTKEFTQELPAKVEGTKVLVKASDGINIDSDEVEVLYSFFLFAPEVTQLDRLAFEGIGPYKVGKYELIDIVTKDTNEPLGLAEMYTTGAFSSFLPSAPVAGTEVQFQVIDKETDSVVKETTVIWKGNVLSDLTDLESKGTKTDLTFSGKAPEGTKVKIYLMALEAQSFNDALFVLTDINTDTREFTITAPITFDARIVAYAIDNEGNASEMSMLEYVYITLPEPTDLALIAENGVGYITGKSPHNVRVRVKGDPGEVTIGRHLKENGETLKIPLKTVNDETLHIDIGDIFEVIAYDFVEEEVSAPVEVVSNIIIKPLEQPTNLDIDRDLKLTGTQSADGTMILVTNEAGVELKKIDVNANETFEIQLEKQEGETFVFVYATDIYGNRSYELRSNFPAKPAQPVNLSFIDAGLTIKGEKEFGITTVTVYNSAGEVLKTIEENERSFTVVLDVPVASPDYVDVSCSDKGFESDKTRLEGVQVAKKPKAPSDLVITREGDKFSCKVLEGNVLVYSVNNGEDILSPIPDTLKTRTVTFETPLNDKDLLNVHVSDTISGLDSDKISAVYNAPPEKPTNIEITEVGDNLHAVIPEGTKAVITVNGGDPVGYFQEEGDNMISSDFNPPLSHNDRVTIYVEDKLTGVESDKVVIVFTKKAPINPDDILISELGGSITFTLKDDKHVPKITVNEGEELSFTKTDLKIKAKFNPYLVANDKVKINVKDLESNLESEVTELTFEGVDITPTNLKIIKTGIGTNLQGSTSEVYDVKILSSNQSELGTVPNTIGNFSYTLAPPVYEGNYIYVASMMKRGDEVIYSEPQKVESHVLTRFLLQPTNLVVSEDRLSISGDAEEGDTVTLNGYENVKATVKNKKFTAVYEEPLSDDFIINVGSEDQYGNVSQAFNFVPKPKSPVNPKHGYGGSVVAQVPTLYGDTNYFNIELNGNPIGSDLIEAGKTEIQTELSIDILETDEVKVYFTSMYGEDTSVDSDKVISTLDASVVEPPFYPTKAEWDLKTLESISGETAGDNAKYVVFEHNGSEFRATIDTNDYSFKIQLDGQFFEPGSIGSIYSMTAKGKKSQVMPFKVPIVPPEPTNVAFNKETLTFTGETVNKAYIDITNPESIIKSVQADAEGNFTYKADIAFVEAGGVFNILPRYGYIEGSPITITIEDLRPTDPVNAKWNYKDLAFIKLESTDPNVASFVYVMNEVEYPGAFTTKPAGIISFAKPKDVLIADEVGYLKSIGTNGAKSKGVEFRVPSIPTAPFELQYHEEHRAVTGKTSPNAMIQVSNSKGDGVINVQVNAQGEFNFLSPSWFHDEGGVLIVKAYIGHLTATTELTREVTE